MLEVAKQDWGINWERLGRTRGHNMAKMPKDFLTSPESFSGHSAVHEGCWRWLPCIHEKTAAADGADVAPINTTYSTPNN